MINSDTGTLIRSRQLENNYLMKGLGFQYEWTDDSIYFMCKTCYSCFCFKPTFGNIILNVIDTPITGTSYVNIEKSDINTFTSSNRRQFINSNRATSKYGIIGSNPFKTFVLAIGEYIYTLDDELDMLYHYDIQTVMGPSKMIHVHLGTNSFVVTLLPHYIDLHPKQWAEDTHIPDIG